MEITSRRAFNVPGGSSKNAPPKLTAFNGPEDIIFLENVFTSIESASVGADGTTGHAGAFGTAAAASEAASPKMAAFNAAEDSPRAPRSAGIVASKPAPPKSRKIPLGLHWAGRMLGGVSVPGLGNLKGGPASWGVPNKAPMMNRINSQPHPLHLGIAHAVKAEL